MPWPSWNSHNGSSTIHTRTCLGLSITGPGLGFSSVGEWVHFTRVGVILSPHATESLHFGGL